jgi:microcystin synthetase protein McyJ
VRTEFFDTAEVALNDGAQSWGNLGLWDTASTYSDACRALALALGTEAGLDERCHVFDAGFGCGDQLLLWLEHFKVASVQGVNLSNTQTDRARESLKRRGYGKHSNALHQGNINDPARWPEQGQVNRVLCLDSAYHFPRRTDFLTRAARCLPAGGVLCLTDFVLSESYRGGVGELLLRAMLACSRIPRENLVTLPRYREQLADAGFEQVQTMDISEPVMLGFSHWWSRYRRNASHLPKRSRLKYAVTARFLRWAHRRQILQYILIAARRG